MRTRALDCLHARVDRLHGRLALLQGPLAVAALVLVALSCAARRTFSVISDPPGAVLRIDDRVVGRTPYEENFDAYGKRRITLYKEGYRTLSKLVDIDAPWYGAFPFDIFSEVLLPMGWRDPHPFYVVLEPESGAVSAPDLDKVIERAENVRLAGPEGPRTLPPRPKPEPAADVPKPEHP